ncbi:phosphopantetheine-binding protein [Streptomyces gamaensis]|uniref:Phosphopantetheine-binding protein n=1 Tax=Streptomyces gamaensis TaxID=1763542 RepID=A0ABW0YQX3_9ACTN
MDTDIRDYVLDTVRNVMNIHVADPVDENTPIGPGGLDLDSLSLLELAARLEKEYAFKIDDGEYETLGRATLGAFVSYVARLRTTAA